MLAQTSNQETRNGGECTGGGQLGGLGCLMLSGSGGHVPRPPSQAMLVSQVGTLHLLFNLLRFSNDALWPLFGLAACS